MDKLLSHSHDNKRLRTLKLNECRCFSVLQLVPQLFRSSSGASISSKGSLAAPSVVMQRKTSTPPGANLIKLSSLTLRTNKSTAFVPLQQSLASAPEPTRGEQSFKCAPQGWLWFYPQTLDKIVKSCQGQIIP